MLIRKRINIKEKVLSIYQRHLGWMIFILVTLVAVLTVYNIDVYVENNLESIKHVDFWKSVIDFAKGVLGTLTGIWVVYIILRPKLKIYPIFALVQKGTSNVYGKVLVKNTNFTDLFDIEVFMQGCYVENGILKTENFIVEDAQVPVLRNRLYPNECSHAWRTVNPKKSINNVNYINYMNHIEVFEYIRCRVVATHSLSGIRFVTEHTFLPGQCIEGNYDNNNHFIRKQI